MIKIDKDANKIINILQLHGFEAYVVGGAVRDCLLSREVKDWDICTDALPEQILDIFSGYKTIPTGLKHGTITVVLNNKQYEVTTFRIDGKYFDNRRPNEVKFTSDLVEDLSRRDFTINAMAYNEKDGLVDPFCGKNDLSNRSIKAVGSADKRFQEDALRMMRAIRFACQLEFDLVHDVSNSIIKNKQLINNISQERIRDELCKTLLSYKPVNGIQLLKNTGLLEEILPEVQRMVNFDQCNPNHDKDVYEHTMIVLDNTSNDLILRLSALLHDIGKPMTFSVDNEGVGHFYKHHLEGVIIAENILKRLKFDSVTVDKVSILIREHMSRYDFLRSSSIKKFINRVGIENLDNLFKLQIADIKGSKPPHDFSKVLDLKEKVEKIINEKQPLTVKDLDINGYDLIKIGIKPGKQMGEMLNNLLEQVLENPDLNKKEKLLMMI